MEENQVTPVATEQPAAEGATQAVQEEEQATTTEETKGEEPAKAEEAPKSFTQDEVNAIVKERLERQESKFLERLGIEAKEGIDDLLAKSKGYDEAKEREGNLLSENRALRESIALIKNSVDPNREDDVRTYFKGKGIDLTEETLKEAMETHPEWRSRKEAQTTIKALTPQKDQPKTEDDWEYTKRLFGLR